MSEAVEPGPGAAGGRKSLPVAQKPAGIVLASIAAMAAVVAIGSHRMSGIGDELVEIAEHGIPMSGMMTNIAAHRLEQAVAPGRAVRFGDKMQTETAARGRFGEAGGAFERLSGLADTADKRDLDEFTQVFASLREIDEARSLFGAHAREIFDALRNRAIDEIFAEQEKEAGSEAAKLDRALKELSARLGEYAGESARKADEHEKRGFLLMTVAGLAASVIGLAIATALARTGIAQPLSEVAQAMNAVSRGDASATLEIRSDDETGTAAGQVPGAGEEMSRQAGGMRGRVDKFLREIRTG